MAEKSQAEQHIARLQQEIHSWQHQYEALRLQKGGFGFKALLATGFAATVIALVAGWLLFRQREANAVLFEEFQTQAGFKIEYAIAHKDYPEAEKILSTYRNTDRYLPIKPQLDMMENMVKACRGSEE